MSTYHRTLHPRGRAVLRSTLRPRRHRALHRRRRRPMRRLTAVRVNWLRVANRLLSELIQCHYRLFPEDSPRAQRRRTAARKKQQEALAWQRESTARLRADLERIYGDKKM